MVVPRGANLPRDVLDRGSQDTPEGDLPESLLLPRFRADEGYRGGDR
jgi:hypothetical protein